MAPRAERAIEVGLENDWWSSSSYYPVAPEDLLSLIVCTCKVECVQNCECRKSSLNCSNLCSNCSGLGCINRDMLIIEDDVDDDLQLDEGQEDSFPTTRLNELFDAH
ncbi:hypothetical protein AVEN_120171-1 [Araneus ventricosus]|uniref:Tesmin/TSO1-like CXC domain-containing protein n=1 Tax=Araneus ventricosus TaxID=182803 RepID=A0A4Y2GNA9_ARAVE|nr:hypothetical protein AVEN_120171-1 [Araneus ventricosus]